MLTVLAFGRSSDRIELEADMIRSFKKIINIAIIATFVLIANSSNALSEPIKLMVFGDSLVAGYNLPQEDAYPYVLEDKLYDLDYDIEVINAGVSGDTTSGGLTRFRWVLGEQPDFLIIELGANDMLRGIDPKITKRNLEKMLVIAQDRNVPVLLMGMRSLRGLGIEFFDKFLNVYKKLAKKYDVPLYPFFLEGVYGKQDFMQLDGLHPNKAGVHVLVDNTLPMIRELIGPPRPRKDEDRE